MAWRYQERHLATGDVVSAKDWNDNLSPFVSEINGYLDRDNLPRNAYAVGDTLARSALYGVYQQYTVGNASSTGMQHSFNAASQKVSTDTASWQEVPGLQIEQAETTSDELWIVEAGVSWQHTWRTLSSGGNVRTYDGARIEFMLTVDGFEVAYGGPFSMMYSSANVYLCGCIPISSGKHDIKFSFRLYHDGTSSEYWSGYDLYMESGALTVIARRR
jgi:hypothetical protein